MKTLTLALTLTAALTAGVAQAQTMEPARTVVRYADLDIDSPAGARALLGRIRAAAARECGGSPSTFMSINAVRLHGRCVEAATSEAVNRVGSPTLTAQYQPSQSNALVRGR